MVTPYQSPPPAAPEALPHGPIWAPTPGVPVAARVLSYTFAALVGMVLLMSFLARRPPDMPIPPDKWEQYKSSMGYIVPYPADWVKEGPEKREDLNGELIEFVMPTEGMSLNSLFCLAIDLQADTEDRGNAVQLAAQLDKIREKRFSVVSVVGDAFTGYQSGDTPDADPAGLHTFTFHTSNSNVAMTGSWCLLRRGHRFVYLEGVTPAAGKPIMDQLVTEIAQTTAL